MDGKHRVKSTSSTDSGRRKQALQVLGACTVILIVVAATGIEFVVAAALITGTWIGLLI